MKDRFLEKIFSIKNDTASCHKVITVFGAKLKIKNHSKYKQKKFQKEIDIRVSNLIGQLSTNQQKMVAVCKLHSEVFPKYRGCNIDTNIVIVGCGPTLNYFNPIPNSKYIALNRAISYEKVKFDYLFCIDARDDMREWLKKYTNYDCEKFYGIHIGYTTIPYYHTNRGYPYIPETDTIRDMANRYYSNLGNNEIYLDITTAPLADFGSVAHSALHFALYTNPKKIYLTGLDTSNNGYFYKNKALVPQNMEFLESTINGYKIFAKFAAGYYPDTEIISVNPVGLKGIFKDVYTRSYVDAHPELKKENLEIIDEESICKNL